MVDAAGTQTPGGRAPPGRQLLVVEHPRLERIEAFGWRLLRAVRPYLLLALAGSATVHLVADPSWVTVAVGAGGAAGSVVSRYPRWRAHRHRALTDVAAPDEQGGP